MQEEVHLGVCGGWKDVLRGKWMWSSTGNLFAVEREDALSSGFQPTEKAREQAHLQKLQFSP